MKNCEIHVRLFRGAILLKGYIKGTPTQKFQMNRF